MKYIGNLPEYNIVHTHADRYDYVYSSNPTIDVNPSVPYATWLNSATGELFVCIDVATDSNLWKGQLETDIGAYYLPTGEILSSYSTTIDEPNGLTFDGVDLIVGDRDTDNIFKLNGISGTIKDSIAAPSDSVSGIAWDGVNLISADNTTDMIYVHNGFSTDIIASFPIAAPIVANGLCVVDGNLLEASYSAKKIYIHDGITSGLLETINLNHYSDGVAWDGVNMIVNESDHIYVYSGLSSTLLTSFAAPTIWTQGIAMAGVNLVSVNRSDCKIYVHKRSDET